MIKNVNVLAYKKVEEYVYGQRFLFLAWRGMKAFVNVFEMVRGPRLNDANVTAS